MGRLAGKVALISGTAGGQGRAAAILFAREGARVVGSDLDGAGSAETAAMVNESGGAMLSVGPLDLSVSEEAERWIVAAVETFGGIDILYNNASAARFSPMPEVTDAEWSFVLRHELDIVFFSTRSAWSHLAKGGGSVVNTASASGLMGNKFLPATAHAAAKAGVIGMTRQLAAEGAAHGIRVNSVTPGIVASPATASLLAQGPGHPAAAMVERTALGLGEPEDVAYGALYLASDEARWVTGSNLVIDGGRTSLL
jgi:meso-butanediol dehydrogenase/(S,S)-butanediol dehydrogenase/diacetyl reductase